MTDTSFTNRAAPYVPRASSRLTTALEILTVAATLALGVAFVGSMWPQTPESGVKVVRACDPGSTKC